MIVTEQGARDLRVELYEDGKIDKDEADAMFKINDAVTGNDNHPSYQDLFVETIADYVLEDECSPGVIDEEEGQYLVDKIQGDGEVDEAERALSLFLKENAEGIISASLNELIASIK